MKKLILVFLFFFSTTLFALAQDEAPKYARSALTMIQLQYDGELDKITSPAEKERISQLYQNYISYQFPDKYDRHQVTTKIIPMSAVNAKPFEVDATKIKGLEKVAYDNYMSAKNKLNMEGVETISPYDGFKQWNIYKNPDPDWATQNLRSYIPLGKDGLPQLPKGVHDIYKKTEQLSTGSSIDKYYAVVDANYYKAEYDKWSAMGSLGYQKHEQQVKAVLKDYDIARQVVAKWFNFDGQPKADGGYFDMQVIAERGYHNAGELDKMNAEGGARSARSLLEEEGELLIGNSFVMLNALVICPNEPVERATYESVVKNYGEGSLLAAAAKKLYESRKDGYSARIFTSLWKLKWDDSVLNEFYEKCWNNPEYFKTTDMFEMEFIGLTDYSVNIAFSSGKNNSQVLSLCLARCMDKVFYKFQKDYEVFRPIVTLMQDSPYMTIDAGLKESLSQNGGEKFEQVKLAQKEDGAYFYKKTGVTVSTTKGYIYSNNLNPDTKYSYSDDNTFTDTVYNKETKSTEQKVWRWIDYQQPADGKIVDGVLYVDLLAPSNKNDAKEIALVQETLSALSIKCDSSEILKCQDPWNNSITYYVQHNGQWIVVPQIGPDGKVLKGTVVKGAKLPAGTLLRQSTFNKE